MQPQHPPSASYPGDSHPQKIMTSAVQGATPAPNAGTPSTRYMPHIGQPAYLQPLLPNHSYLASDQYPPWEAPTGQHSSPQPRMTRRLRHPSLITNPDPGLLIASNMDTVTKYPRMANERAQQSGDGQGDSQTVPAGYPVQCEQYSREPTSLGMNSNEEDSEQYWHNKEGTESLSNAMSMPFEHQNASTSSNDEEHPLYTDLLPVDTQLSPIQNPMNRGFAGLFPPGNDGYSSHHSALYQREFGGSSTHPGRSIEIVDQGTVIQVLPAPSGIKRKNSSPNCEGPIKISKEKEKKGVGAPRKDQEGRRDIAETDRERLMALLERPLICHSKGATEMERQFWVAYNDTRARLNRPHHDPFCRCDPCRGWEIIEFLIAEEAFEFKDRTVALEQTAVQSNNPTYKSVLALRLREKRQKESDETKRDHYVKLHGQLMDARALLGLSVGLLEKRYENHYQEINGEPSRGAVPVVGRIGEDEEPRGDSVRGVPTQMDESMAQYQTCTQEFYKVLGRQEAAPLLDGGMNEGNFMERSIAPVGNCLRINKETKVWCNCARTNSLDNEKVHLIDNYPLRQGSFADIIEAARVATYKSKTGNLCPDCNALMKRTLTLSPEGDYVLLKGPPESLPFPIGQEMGLGVPSALVFFIQKTEAGVRPWRQWRGRWQFFSGGYWIDSRPPPTCSTMLYMLFKKL